MPVARPTRAARKPAGRYHHGDLPRAMLQEAVRMIQTRGIEALTLRGVGERLGVSRSALYRHFADKQALLRAVAGDGFRTLRDELLHAWEVAGRGRRGFEAMGVAYVRFAVAHPAHYRVMFSGIVPHTDKAEVLDDSGPTAFQVLVNAILEQQAQGLVRKDDPLQLARFIWAVVHGVAMLVLDGVLPAGEADALVAFANERLRTGIAA